MCHMPHGSCIDPMLLPNFFKSLLCGNSGLLKKIVHARIALSASYKNFLYLTCWTAELIDACEGQCASNRYTECVKATIFLPVQDFVVHQHVVPHGPANQGHWLQPPSLWLCSLVGSLVHKPSRDYTR